MVASGPFENVVSVDGRVTDVRAVQFEKHPGFNTVVFESVKEDNALQLKKAPASTTDAVTFANERRSQS